jgi:hypothetical protein
MAKAEIDDARQRKKRDQPALPDEPRQEARREERTSGKSLLSGGGP